MRPFADENEVYRYIGGTFEAAFKDDDIGLKLADTGLVLRFAFTEPDSVLLIDMAGQQVHQGNVPDLRPPATMSMKTETANAYWQGRVNLPFAMSRGKITVDGNVASLLKLAPVGKELYPVYIEKLRNDPAKTCWSEGIAKKGAGKVTGMGGGVVGSEFAEVAASVDTTANGPRLRLEDRRTGRVRFLDALVFLDNVRFGRPSLIGVAGQGLRQVFAGLNPERILGPALCNGVGRCAVSKASEYAR